MVRWLREPLPMLQDLSARFGPAFSVRVPRMEQPMVFFSDPAAVKQIWAGDPEVFRAGEANNILKSSLGANSILLLDGERHLRERRLMLPPFHGERMKAYGIAMRDSAAREVATWPIGKVFPIQHAMQGITLDVIMRTIFGVEDETRLAPLREALVRWTTLATSRLGTALLLLTPPQHATKIQKIASKGLGRLLPWASIVKAAEDTDRVVRELIAARRREHTEGREDVLSMLLEARDEQGQRMTDDELRDDLFTLLLVGHETTATTLTWGFWALLGRPDVVRKIRAERRAVFGDGDLDPARIAELVYLDAVVKEITRLHPVTDGAARLLKAPTRLGRWYIPADVMVAGSTWLTHRNPKHWHDPDRFDPDRFLKKTARPTPFSFLPFGGGPRTCIGAAFATMEMKIVLLEILDACDLKLARPDRPRVVRRAITLAADGGVPVTLTGPAPS